MRSWSIELVRSRLLEVTMALALGLAVAALAKATSAFAFDIIGQLVGRNPFDEAGFGRPEARYLLNFEIGSTVVFYGDILAALVALALIAVATRVVVRRRDRELGVCPFCASRIPYDSTHCAYCGSGVAPGEP